jgi:hypothetical protein
MPKSIGKTRITEFAMMAFKSLKFLSIELRFSDKSFLKPTRKRISVKRLRVIVNGMVVKGCEMPRLRYNWLINNPTNIKNAILKPTENNITSTTLVSFSLRSLRRTNPGINER